MHVVAFLPTELLDVFHAAVGATHVVHAATEPAELHRLLRATDVELLVVDPMLHEGRFVDAVALEIAGHRHFAVIAYTALNPLAVRQLLRLAQSGVQHVILRGIDDDRQGILELIGRLPQSLIGDLMLQALEAPISLLPSALRRAVEVLFLSPDRVRQATDLAAMAGMTRRSLNRHMTAAGLQPRHLIACARLLRAYALLRVPGSRLKEISAKLGCDPQSLNALFLLWTGYASRGVRDSLSPEAFVTLLAGRLQRASASLEASIAVC